MIKDEALKLALEALVFNQANWQGKDKAITAIKEALMSGTDGAQPEHEPVAFVKGCNRGQWEIFPAKAYQIFEREQPLYTTPPPVAEPHKRKPLTDEEIDEISKKHIAEGTRSFEVFARAIEAAHGIKELA